MAPKKDAVKQVPKSTKVAVDKTFGIKNVSTLLEIAAIQWHRDELMCLPEKRSAGTEADSADQARCSSSKEPRGEEEGSRQDTKGKGQACG